MLFTYVNMNIGSLHTRYLRCIHLFNLRKKRSTESDFAGPPEKFPRLSRNGPQVLLYSTCDIGVFIDVNITCSMTNWHHGKIGTSIWEKQLLERYNRQTLCNKITTILCQFLQRYFNYSHTVHIFSNNRTFYLYRAVFNWASKGLLWFLGLVLL